MKVDWGQSGLQLAVCSAVVLPAARRHTNTNSLKQSSHCEGQRADNVLLLLFFNNDTSFFIETLIFTAETARGSDPWFWFVPVSVFQWWKKDSLTSSKKHHVVMKQCRCYSDASIKLYSHRNSQTVQSASLRNSCRDFRSTTARKKIQRSKQVKQIMTNVKKIMINNSKSSLVSQQQTFILDIIFCIWLIVIKTELNTFTGAQQFWSLSRESVTMMRRHSEQNWNIQFVSRWNWTSESQNAKN